MALMECGDCRKRYTSDLAHCPECGRPAGEARAVKPPPIDEGVTPPDARGAGAPMAVVMAKGGGKGLYIVAAALVAVTMAAAAGTYWYHRQVMAKEVLILEWLRDKIIETDPDLRFNVRLAGEIKDLSQSLRSDLWRDSFGLKENANLISQLTISKEGPDSPVEEAPASPMPVYDQYWWRYNPLVHLAASDNRVDVMAWLLENGIVEDIDGRPGAVGLRAIEMAAEGGHVEAMQWLKDHGAAVSKDAFLQRLSPRLSQNLSAPDDTIVLERLILHDHWEAIRWLAEHGANPGFMDGPLPSWIYAFIYNKMEALELLVSLGMDPDFRDYEGLTPMMMAALNGDLKTMRFLLAKGADINAKTNDTGRTAMHYAAAEGNVAVLQWLEENGVDRSIEDNGGQTPFIYALMMEKEEAMQWLGNAQFVSGELAEELLKQAVPLEIGESADSPTAE